MNRHIKILIGVVLAAGIFALLLYQKKKVDVDYSQLTNMQVEKFKRMRNELHGKTLGSLSKILGDSVLSGSPACLVFYYNPGDCGSCIKKGQSIIEKLNARLEGQHVYIISARMRRDSLKKKFLGTNPVYLDQQNEFMQESGYTYTPLFLILNKKARVLDSFQVISGINDSAKVHAFIANAISITQF